MNGFKWSLKWLYLWNKKLKKMLWLIILIFEFKSNSKPIFQKKKFENSLLFPVRNLSQIEKFSFENLFFFVKRHFWTWKIIFFKNEKNKKNGQFCQKKNIKKSNSKQFCYKSIALHLWSWNHATWVGYFVIGRLFCIILVPKKQNNPPNVLGFE